MQRNIFIVNASIVDANGSFNFLSGYPKVFDSIHYDNDINKALKRAEGEYHDTIGTLCKRDDRQLQVVTITDATGFQIENPFVLGAIADLPDPEPEEEPAE